MSFPLHTSVNEEPRIEKNAKGGYIHGAGEISSPDENVLQMATDGHTVLDPQPSTDHNDPSN
jgi:hypothetical protein